VIPALNDDDDDDDDDNNNKTRNQETTVNIHIGHCTHTSGNTNVKYKNLTYEMALLLE
jgi:hypothetical protein